MYDGVNVGGQKLSVGFVFRVVNQTTMYQLIPYLLIIQMDRVMLLMEYSGSISYRFIETYPIYI